MDTRIKQLIFLFIAAALKWVTNAQTASENLLAISGACEDSGDIVHVDWDDLMEDASNAPTVNISMNVNDDTMTLHAMVRTPYIGYSLADDATPGYGTMTVIDFGDLDASEMDITETGNCANLDKTSTSGASWEDLWTYNEAMDGANDIDGTFVPYISNQNFWNVSVAELGVACTDVVWMGKWTWYELMGCQNSWGPDTSYVTITEDASWVNMSGSLVVNLVSPLGLNSDTGFYRVYQLASQPFLIAVHKTVNVISSTGIDLFVVTIIAVFKENINSDLQMVVLTEAADYLELYNAAVLTDPTGYSLSFGNDGEDTSGGCMSSV